MNVYEFSVKDLDEKDVSLEKYRGKVLLIVNTAPKCGYASQYEGLEDLYKEYKDKDFEVLDFPSNQFMNQAPGTNEEINSVCELTYGTTYPRFSKVNVNGKDAIPLFKYLKSNSPKELKGPEKEDGFIKRTLFGSKIKWNFTKFLVNRDGKVVKRFSPGFEPKIIAKYIEEIL